MKKTLPTIVFFGSGPVAAESLRQIAPFFNIEAVVTKPRPLHHKGDVPVIRIAQNLNLKIFTVSNSRDLDRLINNAPFGSKVAVLVDFGIIVSQAAIDYFPLGIVNSHFSLLPQWRGADPITFAVLSGQTSTGVSLMLLVAAMDEGPLLAQSRIRLSSDITTPELTEQLIELSSEMLKHILPLYLKQNVTPIPQLQATIAEDAAPSYSRRLTKQDGMLNWQKPAEQLEKEIRAFLGWPKSKARFGSLEVIITKASLLQKSQKFGSTAVIDKQPVVFCGQDALVLERLRPAGKKEMTGKAFLAGYKSIFLNH